jgi:hypothetical protein
MASEPMRFPVFGTETTKATNVTMSSTPKGTAQDIIGLPPLVEFGYPGNINNRLVRASFPVVTIIPAMPTQNEAADGLHIYTLDSATGIKEYNKTVMQCVPDEATNPELAKLRIKAGQTELRAIHVAHLNEGPPSESFSQDYGPSFLEEMLSGIGQGNINDLRFLTGAKSGSEAYQALQNRLGAGTSGVLGTVAGAVAQVGLEVKQKQAEIYEVLVGALGRSMGTAGLTNLLSGSKVDFPSIWRGSAFSTSHSITCRLYNPFAGNETSYCKYILAPLIKLLAFVLPRKDEGAGLTYNHPVLIRAYCTGLWEIPAGYVQSIEVIKGGDTNDLSFKHHPGIVDVRMTFGEIYGVMTPHIENSPDRHTASKYIQNLLDDPSIDLTNLYTDDPPPPETLRGESSVAGRQSETNPVPEPRVSGTDKETASVLDTQQTTSQELGNVINTARDTILLASNADMSSSLPSVFGTITGPAVSYRLNTGILNNETNPLHEDLVQWTIDNPSIESTIQDILNNTNIPDENDRIELAEILALHAIREIRDCFLLSGLDFLNTSITKAIDGRYTEEIRTNVLSFISKITNLPLNSKNALPSVMMSYLNGTSPSNIGYALRKGQIGIYKNGMDRNMIKNVLDVAKGIEPYIQVALDGGAEEINNLIEGIMGCRVEMSGGEIILSTTVDSLGDTYYEGASNILVTNTDVEGSRTLKTNNTPSHATLLWNNFSSATKDSLNTVTNLTYDRFKICYCISDMLGAISMNLTSDILETLTSYITTKKNNSIARISVLDQYIIDYLALDPTAVLIANDIQSLIDNVQLKVNHLEDAISDLNDVLTTLQQNGL